MESRGVRIWRAMVGERPRRVVVLLAPTAFAFALDIALRGRLLLGFRPAGQLIYFSGLLVSAGLWFFPMWLGARLWTSHRRAVIAVLALVLFPLATFAYGAQTLYYTVFHGYIGRDTVRLGIALRGTVGGWLTSWGSPLRFGGVVMMGMLVTIAIGAILRRAAPATRGRVPILGALTFAGGLVCIFTEGLDSRYLQASPPDACFSHGAAHAFVAILHGDVRAHQGMAVRTPAPLPPLVSARSRPPNVVVIFTESVRADALCSSTAYCVSPFLDDVAPDRLALGRMSTQAPNTFSASMILFTGLAPNTDFRTAHTAPVLWELAHAVGYRTAYVTAQNTNYENFSAFVLRAGIDHLMTASDLGGVEQEHIGAPDERALADGLRFARDAGDAPYFEIVHLSNTHAPYRSDPALRPFTPDSDDPLGDAKAFHNHYRNSVRMQERSVSATLRELRALPSWSHTVVLFLSDHGETFYEHGAIYHNHSLFEPEVRIPGWLLAGPDALTPDERQSVANYVGSRTYTQDVHATIVDLFGIDRTKLTFDDPAARSLVRARPAGEPLALMATTTAVWEADVPIVGAMQGERKVAGPVGGGPSTFGCFDISRHPSEIVPSMDAWCLPMIDRVRSAFAGPPD